VSPRLIDRINNLELGSTAQLPGTEFGNFQDTKDVTQSPVARSSCPMPFLDAQAKRVKELGYDVPNRSQKDIPSSIEKPLFEQQRVFSSLIAGNFPGYVNSALNKPNNININVNVHRNNEKPININVHRNIHKDSYHNPPDYVDQLAKFDPAMAKWQMMRNCLDQFK